MASTDLDPAELDALRATWARLHPHGCRMTFEEALAWAPMARVLRNAQRGFDASRQSVAHPVQRAEEHAARVRPLPAQRTRDHTPPRAKRKTRPAPTPTQPDAKQRQANDVEAFTEESHGH